jgi:hypothetical protein
VSNRIVMPAYPQTDIRYDKNCEWFFGAQSQTGLVNTKAKNEISKIQSW